MALARYPTLDALRQELNALDIEGAARERQERRERLKVVDGRDLCRVDFGGEHYWLTVGQREVVRLLLEARLESRDPQIDEQTLARAAGLPGRKLRTIFAGSSAWGRLIVKGERAGYFQLAELPEEDGPGEGPRVEEE